MAAPCVLASLSAGSGAAHRSARSVFGGWVRVQTASWGKTGQLGVASLSTNTGVRDVAGCWPAKSQQWIWIGLVF